MLGFRKNLVVVLLAVVTFFTFGCGKEEEPTWSTHVSLNYFLARGFNLRFKEIMTFEEDIISRNTNHNVIRNVMLNMNNLLVVDSDDVITISDRKGIGNTAAANGSHHIITVNCNRISMIFDVQGTTVYANSSGTHEYKGTCHFFTDWWAEEGVYDPFKGEVRPGKLRRDRLATFEFEMRNGVFVLKAPARYSMGIFEGNASLPLAASEVERIINNGVEGVDWSLFSRDGNTYVRIKNNLYERRFNSWVYAGIADAFVTTTWIREQVWIVFEVLDWDEITAPYITRYGDRIVEDRSNVVPGSRYYKGFTDLENIYTPVPWCKN